MNVVTSAMSTSAANSASEMTPFSSARLSTMSSVRPRVFMSAPITADSRQPQAHDARGEHRAAELARDGHHEQHDREHDELDAVEQQHVGLQARVGEEQRQQQQDDEVLHAVGDVLGQARRGAASPCRR